MSIFNSYIGGLHAFFSVWIFCMMQIIPFFLAFILGAAYTERRDGDFQSVWKPTLAVAAISMAGFIITFTAMGMTTTALSKAVFNYLRPATQIGGVVVGLVGFYLLGMLTLGKLSKTASLSLRLGVAFLFGVSMGLAYKPCVTPTLTKIFNYTSSAQTASFGGTLLIFYSLGMATAILLAGMALAWVGMNLKSGPAKIMARRVCGVVLLVAAVLILADYMPAYKRLLVGGFVPASAHDHSESMDMDMGGMKGH